MCDTWIALRSATRTKNVILGKNSDRPIFDCQPLMFYPRQYWPASSSLKLEYVEIPQAEITYATLGSSPYWCWGYEEGINEYGVVIGNEAIYTKSFREAAEAHRAGQGLELGLLGMDLLRLALERSQSAAQAVEVMGELIERYGQFGSGVPTKNHAEGGYDGSFLIADPDEGWVLEAAGRRWVARKVTEDTYSISNEPTIRQQWDVGSTDIEQYAANQGWWRSGEPFDFARAYIDERKPRQVSHLRVMRSRQLLNECAGDITPDWMMRIARDHYEVSFLGGPSFDAADPDFHSICMHVSPAGFTWGNTASSCVAVLPKSADEIPVFWWTPGPPCNGCYVPFFVHGDRLPAVVSTAGTFGKQVCPAPEAATDEFSAESYWWLFRRLNDAVKGDPVHSIPGFYPARNRLVRARFDALEQEFKAQLPDVLSAAQALGKADPRALNDFTAACVERVTAALTELLYMLGG
jgi:secernin